MGEAALQRRVGDTSFVKGHDFSRAANSKKNVGL
jgi:hypothetical protein